MWDVFDILSIAVRWIHAISAVMWIGGSIFYLLVLRPAQRDAAKRGTQVDGRVNALIGAHFREWAHLSMLALIVSGAILTFDRLTEQSTSTTYIATLVVKISISFWLFGVGTANYRNRVLEQAAVVSQEGSRSRAFWERWLRPLISPYIIIYGGLAVVLLSDILKITFEKDITS